MTPEQQRALIEQAHQLHELTKHPGWEVLVDYCNVVMAPVKRRLLNDSGVDTLDEYKKLSGYLAGMHRVVDVPAEVETLASNARLREAESHAS